MRTAGAWAVCARVLSGRGGGAAKGLEEYGSNITSYALLW